MKINDNQIFNLMDTNGRRNDIINALQGYLEILDVIQSANGMSWDSMPNSLAQYEFYKQAIEISPEVFSQHGPFDKLQIEIDNHKNFKEALINKDILWIQKNATQFISLIKKFDLGIEDRARHYTSNLVKLGFTDSSRKISPIGKLLLDKSKLKRDSLEKTLPIDEINIIYLRQLLKLKIFDTNGDSYYSPFNLAIYSLLRKNRFSENDFLELVQGLNPYFDFENIDNLIDTYQAGDIVKTTDVDIPEVLKCNEIMSENVFRTHFKNRKSKTGVDAYWEFYRLLYSFASKRNPENLAAMLTFYELNRATLNKAFGSGKSIFDYRISTKPGVKDFIEANEAIFNENLNSYLYCVFSNSKKLDQIREYSDTTKRVFKASGIISFDNGYVELAYKELCECIFNQSYIKDKIFGKLSVENNNNYSDFNQYESSAESYYCSVTSIADIFDYHKEKSKSIVTDIKQVFDGVEFSKIPTIMRNKRKQEFVQHITKNYPKDRVKEILLLFSDRRNDRAIKDAVSPDATVPTIYEYMVGVAWYYFSNQTIDLLNSLNLTLSANFEPLVHAGGGQGDIVIYEDDKVVMLEATLMNANTQKRGEWEPVLRHSVNLKVDEETNGTSREVTSFFIADEFDSNTINIWKAVAAVPLQSSTDKKKFTNNVVIMPINTAELCNIMDKSDRYNEIIHDVNKLFEVEKVNFDLNWRDTFISKIV